jgi:hypothetical protein
VRLPGKNGPVASKLKDSFANLGKNRRPQLREGDDLLPLIADALEDGRITLPRALGMVRILRRSEPDPEVRATILKLEQDLENMTHE